MIKKFTKKQKWRPTLALGIVDYDECLTDWMCEYDENSECGKPAIIWRGAYNGPGQFDGLCRKCAKKRGIKIPKK